MKVLFSFVVLLFITVTYAQWTAYVPTTNTAVCDILTTDNFELVNLATDSKGRAWQMGGRSPQSFCGKLPSFLRYFDRINHNWTIAWQEQDSSGPAYRTDSALWIDKDDNLYVYGGQSASSTPTCDFWKYSINSKTWLNLTVGDASLNTGPRGVEDATNYPGCRRGSGYWYTPDDNSLWIFSGYDFEYDDPKLPDLWRFNITSQKWAFVAGLLGTITTDDPIFADPIEVTPYQRWAPFCAVDAQYNLWLYGGEMMNDLWMFNRSSGWQYISGNKNISGLGNCDNPLSNVTEGVFSSAHRPYCSAYGSMTYTGSGLALYTSFVLPEGTPKLWLYDIDTQEWAYYNDVGNGQAVAEVLYVPDNSTSPGFVSWTRTNAPHSLWVVADQSFGVFVLDFPQCTDRYNPCSEHATCQEDIAQVNPICTCNEGFEGDGITCTAHVPVSPIAAPSGNTSSASFLCTASVITLVLAWMLSLYY